MIILYLNKHKYKKAYLFCVYYMCLLKRQKLSRFLSRFVASSHLLLYIYIFY